ncbi:hypothetical protein DFH07DRAFT_937109 [Mycena maculata]|uniref:Uncharacterized protein n=1 Tax=Mycena maculata TaxID=230809 RepID=A0AAD7K0L9_9AGAR|nr:hypothetical protein DFH07DRAFT_937109 [Mycena maculata]
MPEPAPDPVEPQTARSGAIYTSADLIYEVIEAEIANAVQPYKKLLHTLKHKLDTTEAENSRLVQSSGTSLQHVTNQLGALKATLAENGLGINADGTLCFIGERANMILTVNEQVKPYATNPADFKLISPTTIVEVLVQCLNDCAQRIEEVLVKNAAVSHERNGLQEKLRCRNAAVEADTRRWDAQRLQLERSKEEQEMTITALTDQLGALRSEMHALEVRISSARAESNEWKAKHQAVETERDSLKSDVATSDGMRVSAEAALEVWKAKSLAAEADLKTAKDESDTKLSTMQAAVDEWKAKCLAAGTDLKTAKDESDVKLLAMQTAVGESEARCFAAEEELKTAKKEGENTLAVAQAEVDTWKTRSLAADKERDAAQSALRDASAKHADESDTMKTELTQWEARGVTWDAERTRHKTQSARNAALITQLKSDIPKLETRLREAETERDQLRVSLATENEQSLTRINALVAEAEELKKKLSALPAPPKPSSPKPSPSMFIKPRTQPSALRPIPDKPPSQGPPSLSPRIPESTQATPMSPQAYQRSFSSASSTTVSPDQTSPGAPLAPVVALQGGNPVRRGAGRRSLPGGLRGRGGAVFRTSSAPQPRAPPVLTPNATGSGEVLVGSPAVTSRSGSVARRDSGTPDQSTLSLQLQSNTSRSSTSKRSAEGAASSPAAPKRSALSSQSNTPSASKSTPKPVPESSLKRSAPSPLLSERLKAPRTSSEVINTPRTSFTRPPTVIPSPTPARQLPRGTQQ